MPCSHRRQQRVHQGNLGRPPHPRRPKHNLFHRDSQLDLVLLFRRASFLVLDLDLDQHQHLHRPHLHLHLRSSPLHRHDLPRLALHRLRPGGALDY